MEHYPQRILLIGKNENDYNLIRKLLDQIHQGGTELHWLSTYETASEALVECQYDLYLIDTQLGLRTGLELLNEVAAKSCQAPIILLTEQHDREVGPEAMKLGATDYLVKSQLEANLLERSIRYTVARKQAELERYRLLTAEEEQRKLAKALHDIAIALNSTLKLDELLERILTNIGRVVPHDTADIMLRENDRVRVVSSRGYVRVYAQ